MNKAVLNEYHVLGLAESKTLNARARVWRQRPTIDSRQLQLVCATCI
jgi:hypothetical protein